MRVIVSDNIGYTAVIEHDEIAAVIAPWFPAATPEIRDIIEDLEKAWTPGSSIAHERSVLEAWLDVTVRVA